MLWLTKKEVKKRLIRLQNLERLYPIARKRIESLEKETKESRTLTLAQSEIIEKLKLRVEELEKMI